MSVDHRVSNRCKHCREPIEYQTDCADGVDRWMHVGTTGDDDPYGPRPKIYSECRTAVAEPGFVSSVDVVKVLREKLAVDEKFISDHHGYCREYPQNARVEFVTELLEKYEHWDLKASDWDFAEDYCNERAAFLNELLVLIAANWENYES